VIHKNAESLTEVIQQKEQGLRTIRQFMRFRMQMMSQEKAQTK
jgi:hypothetical protein